MLVREMSPSCSGLITEEDVAVIWEVAGTEPPLCKGEGDGSGEKSLIPHPTLGDVREGGMLGQVGMSDCMWLSAMSGSAPQLALLWGGAESAQLQETLLHLLVPCGRLLAA